MKKIFLFLLMTFCAMYTQLHAQIILTPVGSLFGCASTGVKLQASGGGYYWLYDQEPQSGVLPIDSNETGSFTAYHTDYYFVLGSQIGFPVGLSNPVLATIETPPAIFVIANYYPILNDTLENNSFTICGGGVGLQIDAAFSANENVLDINYQWVTGDTTAAIMVGGGVYNCTISTNNECYYPVPTTTVNFAEPQKAKIINTGTEDNPILFAKVKNFDPCDASVPKWYQWYHGKKPIAEGGNDAFYTPVLPGKYAVIVGQGPCTSPASKWFKFNPPSQKNGIVAPAESAIEISLYPNPATDWINISGTTGKVIMTNLLGMTVAESFEGRIYVGDLSPGIYIVVDPDQKTTTKVLVQH